MRRHDEPYFHREVSHPAYTAEGVLATSGLIAGEALMGIAVAPVVGLRAEHAFWNVASFAKIAAWLALPVAAFLIGYLVAVPLRKAGAPDEPAPPTAVM